VDIAADTFTRVRRIASVSSGVDLDSVFRDTTVVNGLALDSLDFVQIIQALETEFSLTLSDDEIMRLETVGAVADYITKRLQQ